LRDFPADYTKEALTAVFARFPGFKAVRLVPGREGLAFAEYEDEVGSAVARDAMNGVKLGENTIRVTFQRQ
jgi:RNA recognition motif-containing protein